MIPKFDVYHEELHSSYISFERYKLFLQDQKFSGYIKLDFDKTIYLFFLKEGKDIAYLKMLESKLKLFNFSEITAVLKSNFYLSSYRSPQQVIDFFARCHSTIIILDNLLFDSVEFDKFFNQIESKKITGFLQASRAGEPEKYIYFYSGKIFGYMNIKGRDGLFEKNLDKNQIQTALKNSTIKVYSIVSSSSSSAAASNDISNKRASSSSLRSESKQLEDVNKLKQIHNKDEHFETRRSVIECYEKIFQLLETNIDSVEFTSIWKMCALELSNKYIFLNPFAGEFNYDNSRIDLWEKIELKKATHALDELINAIAKKANLPKDGIKAIKDNYLNILTAYEIRS